MEPLDLTKNPPRSPWERLDGLIMMPRTIDKLRGLLPGGNVGAYKIAGTSDRLLKAIEVDADDLQAVVALAHSDDDVAQWLRVHAKRDAYERINTFLAERRLKDMDLDDFFERYPRAKGMPLDTPLFDLLELDDAATFA
jgi:hypothetical protein